jgi:hypothetical protein
MSQLTQTPSALPTVAGIKAGNMEESASPSASRSDGSMTIAVEGESGLEYLHKVMAQAQGGPTGTGKSEPLASDTLPPCAYIYIPLNSSYTCWQ